jgi:hypothetical protein
MQDTNLYEMLIENDLNPFILFDSNGKLNDFNKEAEFLFNFVNYKELFELALNNASKSYGINKQFMPLSYGKFNFYAILVGYINDDEIALRLFKEVILEDTHKVIAKDIELVNIYSLIELSKSTIFIQSDINIQEIYDVSIPEIKININNFLIALNDSFTLFKDECTLILKVYIKTGEYEVIDNIKYKILCIEFISNNAINIPKNLLKSAKNTNIEIFAKGNSLVLEFTMIM